VSADILVIEPYEDVLVGRNLGSSYDYIENLKVGAGTTAGFNNTTVNLTNSNNYRTVSTFYSISRSYLSTNISQLSGATIHNVTLSLTGSGKYAYVGYGNPNTVLTNATAPEDPINYLDYANYVDVVMANNITYSSWSITGTNNYTFNSDGISYVQSVLSGDGKFHIMFRTTHDVEGRMIGAFSNYKNNYCAFWSTRTEDASKHPVYTIEYTPAAGDTTPPASITNLTNSTATCEQITFDWDNPTDPDFNGTEYWLNDVKGTNFTAADGSWILFGGLTGGLEYTFSTRTFDTSWNSNASFVNMSATPSICGAAPVANFTADNTSVCIGDPVWFNDTSEYTPAGSYDDYFEWDFGDGNTTAGFRTDGYNAPTYNYSFAGNKTVILTVTTKYGSDNETKVDYIEVVDCSLTADFTANQTCIIGIPADIQFNSSCDNTTYKSDWTFGDGGSIDDSRNPLYTYANYGVYNVTHTCAIGINNTLIETKTDYIVIGVNGTVCEGNCTSGGYIGGRDEYPNYLVIGATLGLLFGLIIIRRKEP
jgi:PKD repeat protein